MPTKTQRRNKQKNILWLGLVSFFNDMSSEMIMPILPMFITSLGGGGLIVGLISGIRESVASIFKIVSGYLSDITNKRKRFVVIGYLTSSVFKLLLGFSRLWYHILIFSGLERIGKGLRTAPRDAIIAESTSAQGKGFGVHRALDTAGAIFGSLLVLILFWKLGLGFKSIIFFAAIIGFISLIPLYFVQETSKKKGSDRTNISFRQLPKNLRLFIIIAAIFSLANFSYMFFVLKVQSYLTGRAGIILAILLYTFFNIFYAGFAIPFGKLSDRVGRKKVLIGGYVLFLIVSLGFILAKSVIVYFILFALYGITYAIIDGNQRAFVSDLSPANIKGTALGTFHAVVGFSALPSSLIAGYLWDIKPELTFIYGSAMSLVAIILFMFLKES